MLETMPFENFIRNLISYKQQPNSTVRIAVKPKITTYS